MDRLIGGKYFQEAQNITQRLLHKKSKLFIEDAVRYTKNGLPVEVSISASPIYQKNIFLGTVAVYREITKWKRNREEIIRINRMLRVVSDINQLIITETDPVHVIQTVTERS